MHFVRPRRFTITMELATRAAPTQPIWIILTSIAKLVTPSVLLAHLQPPTAPPAHPPTSSTSPVSANVQLDITVAIRLV